MRRILYLSVVLLVGCTSIKGPRDRRADNTRIDNPALTISQQKRAGRDRLALPENSKTLVPNNSGLTGPYNP